MDRKQNSKKSEKAKIGPNLNKRFKFSQISAF